MRRGCSSCSDHACAARADHRFVFPRRGVRDRARGTAAFDRLRVEPACRRRGEDLPQRAAVGGGDRRVGARARTALGREPARRQEQRRSALARRRARGGGAQRDPASVAADERRRHAACADAAGAGRDPRHGAAADAAALPRGCRAQWTRVGRGDAARRCRSGGGARRVLDRQGLRLRAEPAAAARARRLRGVARRPADDARSLPHLGGDGIRALFLPRADRGDRRAVAHRRGRSRRAARSRHEHEPSVDPVPVFARQGRAPRRLRARAGRRRADRASFGFHRPRSGARGRDRTHHALASARDAGSLRDRTGSRRRGRQVVPRAGIPAARAADRGGGNP